MTLDEFIKHAPTTVRELSEKTGVSRMTLFKVIKGYRMKNYDKARAISEATQGIVRIEDLCEPRDGEAA